PKERHASAASEATASPFRRPGYGPVETATPAGKLPVNGGSVAHSAVQLEAAIGSAGTGSAPVATLPVLRTSMLLPPRVDVARYGRQFPPGSRALAKLVQWPAICRARRALPRGITLAFVADSVLKTYGTSKLWHAFSMLGLAGTGAQAVEP